MVAHSELLGFRVPHGRATMRPSTREALAAPDLVEKDVEHLYIE